MIENSILFLLKTQPFVNQLLISLCLVKFILFILKKKKSWKVYHFIYFDSTHLVLSHSQRSYNSKKLQNIFTITIAFVAVFQIVNIIISNIIDISY